MVKKVVPENSVPLPTATMRQASQFPNSGRNTGSAAAPAPAKKPQGSEQREARVAELRRLYLAGEYKVNSADLSRKIVDAHLAK